MFFGLANRLVFKKVRLALGLDRCKICLSGAAPIMKETLDFFFGLNIPIFEVYGMSESSGKCVQYIGSLFSFAVHSTHSSLLGRFK